MGAEFADHPEANPQQLAQSKPRRRRLGELESQAQASQPESKPRRMQLGETEPQFDARKPAAGEALVDVPATVPPNVPEPQVRPGRRTLSDTQADIQGPQPHPDLKPRRKKLAETEAPAVAQEPAVPREPLVDVPATVPPNVPEPQVRPGRRTLSDIQADTQEPQPHADLKPCRKKLGETEAPAVAQGPQVPREALVDIATAREADELPLQSGSGRPRLMNTEPTAEEPQPQPQPRPPRPRLANTEPTPEEPQPQPQPRPARPRLTNTEPTPEEPQPQPQPRPGRARLTNTETLPREEEPAVVAQQPGGIDPRPQADVHEPNARAHRARLSDEVRDTAQTEAEAQPEAQPDPAQLEQSVAELRARQSFPTAAVGGLIAAVAGGLIWALITVATNHQVGWMAVGVGLLVGGTVRGLGRGLDKSFGYLGAGLSVLGCLLGNYLSICMGIASQEGLSPVTAAMNTNLAMIPSRLIATFHPLDLLFYAIAVYEGYRFSFRRVTGAEAGRVAVQG